MQGASLLLTNCVLWDAEPVPILWTELRWFRQNSEDITLPALLFLIVCNSYCTCLDLYFSGEKESEHTTYSCDWSYSFMLFSLWCRSRGHIWHSAVADWLQAWLQSYETKYHANTKTIIYLYAQASFDTFLLYLVE